MDANYLGFSSFLSSQEDIWYIKSLSSKSPDMPTTLDTYAVLRGTSLFVMLKTICEAWNGEHRFDKALGPLGLLHKIEILVLVFNWFQIHIKCYIITDVHLTTNVLLFIFTLLLSGIGLKIYLNYRCCMVVCLSHNPCFSLYIHTSHSC